MEYSSVCADIGGVRRVLTLEVEVEDEANGSEVRKTTEAGTFAFVSDSPYSTPIRGVEPKIVLDDLRRRK